MAGLFLTGTAGEASLMTLEERKRLCEKVIKQVGSKMGTIVHVGTGRTSTTCALAKHAQAVGADAVSAVTPHYYPMDMDCQYHYFRDICCSTDLPVFLYHTPPRTGIRIPVETMLRLFEIPNFVGIKNTDEDITQLNGLMMKLPQEFLVINGTERHIVYAFLEGCIGNLSGIPNGFPEPYVELYHRYGEGDIAGAMVAQRAIDALRTAIRVSPHPTDLKCAVTLGGLHTGYSRKPLRRFTESEVEAMRQRLAAISAIDLAHA